MLWFVVGAGYLLGSIPTAYIAGRVLRGVDIRCLGDGNMGARNAYWEIGPKTGVAIFIIDAAKGTLAILIARAAGVTQVTVLATGMATVIGHNWPVFAGFRGGRGESTTIGIFLVLLTQPMLIVGGPTLLTLLLRKNVILTSAVLFVSLPLVCWWLQYPGLLIGYSILLPCMVATAHYLQVRSRSTRLRRV